MSAKKPKRVVRVGAYCGSMGEEWDDNEHFRDWWAARNFAERRRRFWDFDEVDYLEDEHGCRPDCLEELQKDLLERGITDLICRTIEQIAGTDEEIRAFKAFLREHGITLHLIEKSMRRNSPPVIAPPAVMADIETPQDRDPDLVPPPTECPAAN